MGDRSQELSDQTLENNPGNSEEMTESNTVNESGFAGINFSMNVPEFNNRIIKRTITNDYDKKRIAQTGKDQVVSKLSEVHREIPVGGLIYSEIVGAAGDWSRNETQGVEEKLQQGLEKQKIDDSPESIRKRANSAGLDLIDEQ